MDVMKHLKKDKARDPLGWANEIFMLKNTGEDLIQSLTLMMNRVKQTQSIPSLFRLRDVTPIYKNKGSRQDLKNDRGVFTGTVPNSIFQKLIYRDIYETIDSNLTDSNVGARKTDRFPVKKILCQGDVNAPVKCTTQMDSISEDQKSELDKHL